jgi:hypothetical protein
MRIRSVPLAGIVALLMVAILPAQAAPEIEYTLDPSQGFAFRSDLHTAVGFITSLSVGGKSFPADFRITVPTTPGQLTPVVGVLTSFSWAGGVSDPIALQARLSVQNRQLAQSLLQQGLSNTNVSCSLAIYGYDPVGQKYFLALSGPSNGVAVIQKNGQILAWSLATSSGPTPSSPQNWAMNLSLVPPTGVAQTFAWSNGPGPVVKSWGIRLP